ncbi:MAG: hypothetical protein LBP31_02950, partial [Holosporales bacterium]|nr:hypothetical protein [Holosporales bacterium]
FGWKLHISARSENAALIAEIVIPILEKFKAHYKIVCSPSILRWFYNKHRYQKGSQFSQMGKFITVYSDSDKQANEIATEIDEAFKKASLTPEDFVPVLGDFQVGTTGGVSTRPCHYKDFFGDPRTIPYIMIETIIVSAKANEKSYDDYEHPFKVLGLYYDDELLPKKVIELREKIRRDLYAPELTNEGYGKNEYIKDVTAPAPESKNANADQAQQNLNVLRRIPLGASYDF